MKAATLLRYWIFFFFMLAAMMSMSIRCELKKKGRRFAIFSSGGGRLQNRYFNVAIFTSRSALL